MNYQDLYSLLPKMTVKSLIRTHDFINNLIDFKTPDDRVYVASLDAGNFVNYPSNFCSDVECNQLMNDLSGVLNIHESAGTKTKSVWFSNTEVNYMWNSV